MDPALRAHFARLLDWGDAHVSFEAATEALEPDLQAAVPDGLPHSPWQLLEHLRIAQADILDFCVNPEYSEKKWPEEYWPRSPAPPSHTSWAESRDAFIRDRSELIRLASDLSTDLGGTIPHGTGQTYLRELLLVADHNAYHIGQLILTRRILGAWNE